MAVTMRAFAGQTDFLEIGDFLRGLYQPDNRDGNWFESIWEYAYTHPLFDGSNVTRIGIWEYTGAIVGVALYETCLGEAFFQVHPAYAHLRPVMLTYAEQYLAGVGDDGERYLKAYVNDFDDAFEEFVYAFNSAQVESEGTDFSAGLSMNLLSGRFELFFRAGNNYNVRPVLCQAFGNGKPDASTAAGY